MSQTLLLCVDGSEASIHAVVHGLAVVRDGTMTIATVIDSPDPMLLTGSTGFAAGPLTATQYEHWEHDIQDAGAQVVDAAKAALGIDNVATVILRGNPGPAICEYAEEQGATVIVMGTRGHGGVKRALLGSVADHVVRNAPCPVVVVANAQ